MNLVNKIQLWIHEWYFISYTMIHSFVEFLFLKKLLIPPLPIFRTVNHAWRPHSVDRDPQLSNKKRKTMFLSNMSKSWRLTSTFFRQHKFFVRQFCFLVVSIPFLESNLDNRICFKIFYGQIVRHQGLCSFMSDFEERTKFLLNILIGRGYRMIFWKGNFLRQLRNILQFQRRTIPVNFSSWFDKISLNSFTEPVNDH